MGELSVTLVEDNNSDQDIETALRICLAHARVESAIHRTDHPATGRAWSIVATHLEDALFTAPWFSTSSVRHHRCR